MTQQKKAPPGIRCSLLQAPLDADARVERADVEPLLVAGTTDDTYFGKKGLPNPWLA